MAKKVDRSQAGIQIQRRVPFLKLLPDLKYLVLSNITIVVEIHLPISPFIFCFPSCFPFLFLHSPSTVKPSSWLLSQTLETVVT